MKRLSNLKAVSKIIVYLCNADYVPIKSIGKRVIYKNTATKIHYIIYNGKYYTLNVSTFKNKTIGRVYYPPYHNRNRR